MLAIQVSNRPGSPELIVGESLLTFTNEEKTMALNADQKSEIIGSTAGVKTIPVHPR